MKFWPVCWVLSLFLNSCTASRPTVTEIVNASKQAIGEIKALGYYGKVVMQLHAELPPAQRETRIYEGQVKLLKDSTLKPVGYLVKLETGNNELLVCTPDSFFFLMPHSQEMHASKLGNKPPLRLRNHAFRSVIGEAFIFADPFLPNPDWDPEITLLGTEKINGQKFWVVQNQEKNEKWTFTRQFYIHRKNYLPLRLKTFYREKSMYQEPDRIDLYEWNATEINYNPTFDSEEFASPALPPGYKRVKKKYWE